MDKTMFLVALVICCLLVACALSPFAIPPTASPYPIYTPYPTLTTQSVEKVLMRNGFVSDSTYQVFCKYACDTYVDSAYSEMIAVYTNNIFNATIDWVAGSPAEDTQFSMLTTILGEIYGSDISLWVSQTIDNIRYGNITSNTEEKTIDGHATEVLITPASSAQPTAEVMVTIMP